MFDNIDNVNIIVKVLKENNINQIVISPGGTNIPIIKAIQDDDFFDCYSVVDERSAMYIAIGIYLQTRKIVATLCTSAQATRNYIPGLTEAFYKRIPILAITMEKHPRFKYQEYMQAPDQASLPRDSVKKSYELPFISDINDFYYSNRVVNEAILELTRDSLGPVQICVPWLDFPLKNQMDKKIRIIERFSANNMPDFDLSKKRVMIIIGEHGPFSESERKAINIFCNNVDSVIYTNHLSNFENEFCVNANLLLSTINEQDFERIKPDIFITIGGQTGDYPLFLRMSSNSYSEIEHWRVSESGDVVDTYDKLRKVFHCSVESFFNHSWGNNSNRVYCSIWKEEMSKRDNKLKVPFSNVSIAQYLHDKLPMDSILQFSILNSLRVWNLFDIDSSIECYSNVGAFGIDGGMSTLIGQSIVSEKLAFMIIGDLAFFYDMNVLGVRHIKNNLRILLINNNGGIEFKLHGGNNVDIDRYIAAGNHYKDAEGWTKTCGFIYLKAHSMSEFINNSQTFLSNSDRPILFEVFVTDADESDAYNMLIEHNRTKSTSENIKYNFKKSMKNFIGEDKYKELKKMIKKNDI